MIVLTGGGSFAEAYREQFDAEVASVRELGEQAFIEKLRRATVVIHNAATIAGDDLETLVERNFDFTRFVVRTLREVNPSAHLVLLSSMSVLDPADSEKYGDPLSMPPYGYSKYLAETYCLKCPLEWVSCVRFSTLFFQDPQKDGLSKLVHDSVVNGKITVYNGGEARRNFLPIRVAVAYVNKISQAKNKDKRTYTLAAPESTSFAEVADVLRKHLPKLIVEDKTIDTAGVPVLAEFHSDDIQRLGPIDFSLEEEVANYLEQLQK